MIYAAVISKNGQMFQDKIVTIGEEPSLQCDAIGIQALTNSWISCFIFQLPFFLENIRFGYITSALNILIILISIFGIIQNNFKYIFIIQAFWDMLIAYDFTCDKPTLEYFQQSDPKIAEELWNHGPTNCFYFAKYDIQSWSFFIFECIITTVRYCQFHQIFIFAFSSFTSIFQQRDKKISTCKIWTIILAVNIVSIFLINFMPIYSRLIYKFSGCNSEVEDRKCHNLWSGLVDDHAIMSKIAPIFALCCILFAAGLIIVSMTKILRQFKNHNQNNKKTLSSSVQILVVLFIQFFMTALSFWLILISDFHGFLNERIILNSNESGTIIYILKECVNLIRSFVNSIIILTIISGYRNSIEFVFRRFINFMKNPRKKLTAKYNRNDRF